MGIIVNIAILIGLLVFLYFLKKKNVKFSNRVFIALAIGVVFGAVLQWIYGFGSETITKTMPWFNIIGNGYVKLLQMVAMPLVFISILAAFTKVTIGKNLGKIASIILAVLIGTTAIAASLGILSTAIFDLDASQIMQGESEVARGEEIVQKAENVKTLPEHILEMFPANPFLDMTGARSTSTKR